jgi:hypothetical protein
MRLCMDVIGSRLMASEDTKDELAGQANDITRRCQLEGRLEKAEAAQGPASHSEGDVEVQVIRPCDSEGAVSFA